MVYIDSLGALEEDYIATKNQQEAVFELEALKQQKSNVPNIDLSASHTGLPPSVLQAPKLELKPLPKHLKYMFLGEQETMQH